MVLRGAVRELWIIFGAKLLAILAYGVMNSTLVLWLSSDLGYSDARAGYMVTMWSMLMTFFTVLVGSLVDAIGLRKAFLLGLCVCLFARGMMTFTTVKELALCCGLLPVAVGEALLTPVMVAAVRRYSTTAQRSISFSIFYVMMNAGFLLGSLIFDYVRQGLGEYGSWSLPLLGVHLTTYRTLFLVSFLLTVPNLALLYFCLREGVEATDAGVKITPEQPKYISEHLLRALGWMARDALRDTGRIFAGLWRQPAFYKFLVFLSLVVGVRLIFFQMYYTYPKFGIRELGEGAPIGRLWAVNSLFIIVLVPIVGALTQRVSAYRMVMIGSSISALSVFLLALPPSWFQTLADGRLGHLIANVGLGGYGRFSVDDIHDLPALARQLQAPSNTVSVWLRGALSPKTRALLDRQLSGADPAAGPGPHPSTALFSVGEIKTPAAFIARLQNDPDPATRSLSQYVWNRFSKESRQTLTNPQAAALDRTADLARELNRLLQGDSLDDPQRLAGVPLSEGTRLWVEANRKGRDPRHPKRSLALNRLLLEEAYPSELARSQNPLRAALTEDLNRLMQGAPLYEQERFAGVALSEETKECLTQNPPGQKLVRLNRLLIEDAYPRAIAQNRVGVPGSVNPYFVMILLYVVMLSVGEALWSPRCYEYTAAIAPKGQEASYMSLSYLPFFVAKLFAGTFSGLLLARFCPETGPRESATLWLVIALPALITPLGLLLLRSYIRVREAGREE
jgi:MFS family permease